MRAELDRRVVFEVIIDLVRSVQAHEPAHLAGGVALSGAHLSHRLSADVDLFVHDAKAHRRACVHLNDAVVAKGVSRRAVAQDVGSALRRRAARLSRRAAGATAAARRSVEASRGRPPGELVCDPQSTGPFGASDWRTS
ncbi:MAG: nucleotidyl transferase AbiEii/AbiGii toxin family protein [Nannocystaceae bacterium]